MSQHYGLSILDRPFAKFCFSCKTNCLIWFVSVNLISTINLDTVEYILVSSTFLPPQEVLIPKRWNSQIIFHFKHFFIHVKMYYLKQVSNLLSQLKSSRQQYTCSVLNTKQHGWSLHFQGHDKCFIISRTFWHLV